MVAYIFGRARVGALALPRLLHRGSRCAGAGAVGRVCMCGVFAMCVLTGCVVGVCRLGI